MESKAMTQEKSEDDEHSLTEDIGHNKSEHECMIAGGTQEQLVHKYVCCL